VLVGGQLSARRAAVRDRIGVPAGKRVVLYMPTYRDQLAQGQARYALNRDLDLELLRRDLSDDHVVLFRKHHYVVGASTTEPDEFVIDVSGYPDATELMLAADVLMTDYSSAMFDWMCTGRPIVYFAPDLEYYRDELRGFYFDLEAIGPGQFVRSSAAVADALRSADELAPVFAERYQEFRSRYCSLDDGGASARVVDALQELLAGRRVDLAVTS
jgi:CDP-glycerol glycerophosphotransferase